MGSQIRNSEKCANPECTVVAAAAAPAAPRSATPSSLQRCGRCKTTAYCSRECQEAAWLEHKKRCRRPNYIVRFHLGPEDITDPPVVRTLSCPADAHFYHLHLALQVAFGWATKHSFDFTVTNPDYEAPTNDIAALQHRMTSAAGRPAAADPSRPQEFLLRIVDPVEQTTLSGFDRVHEDTRCHPNTPELGADYYKLYQLFDDPKYQGKPISYTYDFSNSWVHRLTVVGRAEAEAAGEYGLDFACLGGTGHPVAEGAGGYRGWEEIKEAYRAEEPSAEQRERRRWFERKAANRDKRGLADSRAATWDRDRVNSLLVFDNLYDRFDLLAEARDRRLAVLALRSARSARSAA